MTNHKLITCLLLLTAILHVSAQTNGSNSPYSRFGLGTLREPSQGFNKAMSGVAMGFRGGTIINRQNPASYSAIDSLSFIFDVGMTLKRTTFKSGPNTISTNNTSLDYISAAFRLRRGLGFSFGFVPYSSIGYNYSQTRNLDNDSQYGSTRTYTNTYTGNGGINEVYVGAGWNPVANLSIGANIGYIWGNYDQNINNAFYENGTALNTIDGLNRQLEADISSYKIDIGVQYPIHIGKEDILTPGVTFGLGHTINTPLHYYNFRTNGDTAKTTVKKAFEIPMSFGAGIAWEHKDQWKAGIDVLHQRWGDTKVPQIINDELICSSDNYLNRTKISVGGEFLPDRFSGKYLRRVRYRLGASFATPYFKVNGQDGPREYNLSAGFALPVSKNINSRSLVNLTFQWGRSVPGSSALITENYLLLNVGITFNERWFMKWKIQ